MVQISIGNYYQHLLAHLVKLYMDQEQLDTNLAQKKTVEFCSIDVKWPEVKQLTTKADAVEVFKLGNTQYQKALKLFVCDGYVTEHYRIQSAIAKMYRQLQIIETDQTRAIALVKRRIDLLGKIYNEINH